MNTFFDENNLKYLQKTYDFFKEKDLITLKDLPQFKSFLYIDWANVKFHHKMIYFSALWCPSCVQVKSFILNTFLTKKLNMSSIEFMYVDLKKELMQQKDSMINKIIKHFYIQKIPLMFVVNQSWLMQYKGLQDIKNYFDSVSLS